MKHSLVLYLLLFIFSFAQAQQFGGEPSSVKWKQVNTDTVRVIFPQGLDSIAKRIATITSFEQKNYSNSIGNNLHKVSIVLHNQTTFSNGFVGLGPWHSEFFLTSEQNAFDLGAVSWNDLLSIHEYRHVEQYSNFNIGLSHAMRILFGENGQALANAAAIPDWFFEGDAVYNETLLSEQGRGRLPLFLNGFKSLYLENKHYSYMKLRNGSYKDFVPDHYPLGYMLVAYGREKYGNDFWKSVTHNAVAYKSLFYPMQHAVNNYAHVSFNDFVTDALNYYQQQWKDQSYSNLQFIDSSEKNNVVDEKYPYVINNGSVVVLHKSYDHNAYFELNDLNGHNKKISVQDIASDDYFSCNDDKIIYASYKQNARWGNKEYSELRLLDINTKQEKKITSQTRYFSPDISHDGKMIVAVELLPDQNSNLVFLDGDGKILNSISNQSGHIFSYPKFTADDKSVYVCDRNAAGEMSIVKEDINGDKAISIIPYSNRILGFPVVQNDTLFYSCSNKGNDEIWAYINTQNKNYIVAKAATGLYQAVIINNKILTSAFTANGYKLALINPVWNEIKSDDTLKDLYVDKPFHLASNTLLANIAERNFNTNNYSKSAGFFHFHSWVPYFSDPDYSYILYGENILNTVQSELYYDYNRNENFHRAGYTAIYGGWYVQPFFNLSQTWHRTAALNTDTLLHWNETKFAAGLQLPFDFSSGKFYRYLTLKSSYNFNAIQWQEAAKQLYSNSSFNYYEGYINYSQYIQQALQNIYPRFGQSISLRYRTGSTAHQFLANSYFYFPGFIKTHNLVVNIAYQFRDTSNKYYFENNFPFSRGYNTFDLPREFKAGFNYNFHLFYPDWGFGNIVYFLRVRGNIFYDYTQLKSLRTENHYQFNSAGAEIYFDTKWWNQQPVSFGIRYSHLLNSDLEGIGANQISFILPSNLF